MNIRNELSNLSELTSIGLALADFCEALAEGGLFERSDARWVMRPNNFVTLEPHWKRVKNIAISLRGKPEEFAPLPELPIKAGMSGYSECKVESPRQLAAAAFYIRRAHEIYERGRTRLPKGQKVVET
ncbi:hypothetical protein [Methylomonas rivi]|uniref:Uncharacterized protein n=1 Tax=Methylomonas rivi TaxID=2952226 RepID=A0ABT1UAI9_9GAMM|nr:hypothetical protein [Methylomonas sp. WSC-6]MCQ8130661.1 hypothetical protein [Methylomonas sp. WSC-6]